VPIYDLGDVISLTGGISGDDGATTCVTKYEFIYHSTLKISCAGRDPALSGAKSAVEKSLSQASNSNSESTVKYVDFVNSEVETGEKDVCLIDLNYIAESACRLNFVSEMLLNASDDCEITFKYYVDDALVDEYYPKTQLKKGNNLVHLVWHWDESRTNVPGSIIVYATVSSGSVTAEKGNARASVSGQGLTSTSAWDGKIKLYENIEPFNYHSVYKGMTASVSVKTIGPEESTLSDAIPSMDYSSIFSPFEGKVGNVNYLHRFDAYHLYDLTYDKEKIEAKDGVLKLKDGVTISEFTTYDGEADQILGCTVICDSNNVNFLASFDHGATWWEYSNGWINPDTTKESYGMFGPIMKQLTTEQWAEKLNGFLMIKVIIHEKGTFTEMQLFTNEVKE
ncbi:MAG: hypothetical protein ACI4CX_07520, partial [Candidatus Weimeria sp.]